MVILAISIMALFVCPSGPAEAPQTYRVLGSFDGDSLGNPPVFPLRPAETERYLVDDAGHAFLIAGDTGWSLVAQMGLEDAVAYLDDRRTKGFNAIIVNLIEHGFATDAPRNRFGLPPFSSGNHLEPVDAYFAHAHTVVRLAGERGISVWLAPAYLGFGGGKAGWFMEIKHAGPDAARAYGRYVGRLFLDLPNVVWLMGGDFTPPEDDRWTVTAIAEGIREVDTIHPMAAHGSPEDSGARAFADPPWLDINTTYSYRPDLPVALRSDYRHEPVRPLVLIESTYENEHDSTPEQIRRQAYWAMTTGACGQFFGNCPIWHFDGPGVFTPPTTWRYALDDRGSWDMVRLRNVFASLPWHRLVPDLDGALIPEGRGEGIAEATAAITDDRTLAVVYVPSTGTARRPLTLDLSAFPGPIAARWYNPTDGRLTDLPASAPGRVALSTPGDNGTGTNDWLLLLQATPPPAAERRP
jgi:hypothetical protein